MTLDELASTAATAYGLRWVSLLPNEKRQWINVAKAVRDKIATPDAQMLNAAVKGWRSDNEMNFKAIVRSIR